MLNQLLEQRTAYITLGRGVLVMMGMTEHILQYHHH